MSDSPCTARHINHVCLAVRDIDDTLRFYQGLFGIGEGALRQQSETGAERQHREPEPDPVDQRIDGDLEAGRLVGHLVAGEHDVEILGDSASHGDLRRRLRLMFVEEPAGRVQLVDRLPIHQHGHVRRDHLLPRVGVFTEPVVADRVAADRGLVPRSQQHLRVELVAGPGEPEKHQDNPDMDDVAAIATPRPRDQPDERGEEVGAGRSAPDEGAPHELLPDGAAHERAQREAQAGHPDLEPQRVEAARRAHRQRDRPSKLKAQVRHRRSPPRRPG